MKEIFWRFQPDFDIPTTASDYTTATPDFASMLPPALAGRIAVKRNLKGTLLDIDDRSFFLGLIGDVIDCSIKYYQCYTFAENEFPEALKHIA